MQPLGWLGRALRNPETNHFNRDDLPQDRLEAGDPAAIGRRSLQKLPAIV